MSPSDGDAILLRRFTDARRVAWTVWEVTPRYLEESIVRPYTLDPGLVNGWLAFQSGSGERRRLVPAPPGWSNESDHVLAALCERAADVRA